MQHFKQKNFPNHKKSGREAVKKGEKSVNHNENKGEGIFLKMGLYNIPSQGLSHPLKWNKAAAVKQIWTDNSV